MILSCKCVLHKHEPKGSSFGGKRFVVVRFNGTGLKHDGLCKVLVVLDSSCLLVCFIESRIMAPGVVEKPVCADKRISWAEVVTDHPVGNPEV